MSVYGLHNYGSQHLGMAMDLVHHTPHYSYADLAGPRFPLTVDGVTDALTALEDRSGIRPIIEPLT